VVVETKRSNGRVAVTVRDRGNGIPAEEVARVTERFYRGTEAPAGGSGLGLAIARQLAEKWGGTLSVESTPGEGTRVEVTLLPSPSS
jgi:signal transduction histidine kinase